MSEILKTMIKEFKFLKYYKEEDALSLIDPESEEGIKDKDLFIFLMGNKIKHYQEISDLTLKFLKENEEENSERKIFNFKFFNFNF